jgi:signal transduction histidine kinase
MGKPSRSLRWRVAAAATVFGAALSILFAVAAYQVTEDYELLLIDGVLRRVASGASEAQASPELDRLGLGVHEFLDAEGRELHAAVFDVDGTHKRYVLDLAELEEREMYLAVFLWAVVLIGTGLSSWLGFLLAGRVIRPVGRLARAVNERTAQSHEPLASAFANDELGALASAFDRYHERLLEHAERERAFAAEASHGLRTPVAVVRGATDVLLDDPTLGPAHRQRVARIARGAVALSELIDGLLALARARTPERLVYESVALEPLVMSVVSAHQSELDAHEVRVEVVRESDRAQPIPVAQAEAILRALLRAIGEQGKGRALLITIRDGEVEFQLDVAASEVHVAALAVDRSVALGMAARTVQAMGGSMTMAVTADDQLAWVKIRLVAAAP